MKNQSLSYKVIHIAMCMGILIFLLVAIYTTNKGGFATAGEDMTRILKIVIIIAFAVLVPLAYWIFKVKSRYIRTLTNRDHKLQAYGLAMLIKLALIEGISLFTIVAYLITSDILLMAIALAGLVVMASNYPSDAKVNAVIDDEYQQ